ncbi:hypothetical protein FNAPI_9692 [Fusarium napiforme]|uniref:Uncharacterized protein n=1 Tax=Fusarium napiforme TaxID=42672 RepID=A0A8H5MX11_9HYPO|nr:hypothetical protein FNAPI_9692 [Fusarium napiforme]
MSKDIRTHYNIQGRDADIVASILETRHQSVKKKAMSPGLDCLVVVLRRIYSHVMLSRGVSLDWIEASEAKNPVLRHAWHMFGDGQGEVQEAANDRQEVQKALLDLGFSQVPSFEDLCNSSLMNETFWSQDVFRLTDVLYYTATLKEADGSADEIARASLLELNQVENPGLSLQEIVDRSFGYITWKEQEVLSRPNRAWIVRVLYQPGNDDTARLDINGLRTLHLPIWEQNMNEMDSCFHEVGKAEYSILAVVRLKTDGHPEEYVRTYKGHGANILPSREPESYVNHKWSIKDAPGKYMLFYGLKVLEDAGDPTCFPEVAPPLVSEADGELVADIAEYLSRLMGSKKQKKPPQGANTPSQKPKSTNEGAEASSVSVGGTSKPKDSQPPRGTPQPPVHGSSQEGAAVPASGNRRSVQESPEEGSHQQSHGNKRKRNRRPTAAGDRKDPSGSNPDESERRRDQRRDL